MNLNAILHLDNSGFQAAVAAVQAQLAAVSAAFAGITTAATGAAAASTAAAGAISAAGAAAIAATAGLAGAGAAAVQATGAMVTGAGASSAALSLLEIRTNAATAAVLGLRAAMALPSPGLRAAIAAPQLALPAGFRPRHVAPGGGGGGHSSPGGLSPASQAIGTAVGGVAMSMTRIMGPITAAVGAIGGTAAAVMGFRKAVSSAAEMEDFENRFITLLGSADAARERMEELAKFSRQTNFDLPGVVGASRVLESLTQGALSTGEGLRMVGDVAANTGQPFSDLAMWIGRAYDGLQSGRPVGEALMRLQELGIVSSETRSRIEALQAEGSKGPAAWGVLAQAFGKFAGEMERQASGFNGMMSNLREGIDEVFRAFGEPVNDALKPLIQGAMDLMERLRPVAAELGQTVATTIRALTQAFAAGRVGELAGASLKLGFAEALNFLGRALPAAFQANLAMLSTPGYWKGMINGVLAAVAGIGDALLAAFSQPIAMLNAAMDTARQEITSLARSAFALTPAGAALQAAGVDVVGSKPKSFDENFDSRMAEIQAFLRALTDVTSGFAGNALDGLSEAAQAYVSKFAEAMREGPDAIDTSEMRRALEETIKDLLKAAAPAAEAAAGAMRGDDEGIGFGGKAGSRAVQGHAREPITDRLARIGGFIGPQGGARAQYEQRTAENTSKLVSLTQESIRLAEQMIQENNQVWA